jgi:glycosyltransferase involved in cell wall biosynthesis
VRRYKSRLSVPEEVRRPLVSIVISNLNQTYELVEVVALDDESTDNFLDILKQFDGRITVVSEARGGHVSAINAGFAASRGEVLVFLDADDVLYPNYIARVMRSWRRDMSKVQFRLDTVDAEGIDQQMPFRFILTT